MAESGWLNHIPPKQTNGWNLKIGPPWRRILFLRRSHHFHIQNVGFTAGNYIKCEGCKGKNLTPVFFGCVKYFAGNSQKNQPAEKKNHLQTRRFFRGDMLVPNLGSIQDQRPCPKHGGKHSGLPEALRQFLTFDAGIGGASTTERRAETLLGCCWSSLPLPKKHSVYRVSEKKCYQKAKNHHSKLSSKKNIYI